MVIAAIYAATPLWLPGVIGKQLPDDWQLGQLKTGYPGVSGIDIHSLQLQGRLPKAEVDISATGIRFSYQQFQSHIDAMSVDVYLLDTPAGKIDIRRLDDLSIPLINLPGSYPELSVGHLNLAVHQSLEDSGSAPSFEAAFDRLSLAPHPDGGFHLVSEFNYRDIPLGPGSLEMDLSADLLKADLQFPVDAGVQKWLTISARQQGLQGVKTSEIRAEIDTGSIDSEWLNSIISNITGDRSSQLSGQLIFSASFSGAEEQHIQQLSLDTDNLQFVIDGDAVDLSSRINITRDDPGIIIELVNPVHIQALDSDGKLDQFLQTQFPDVQRSAHSETSVMLVLDTGSRFTITADKGMSVHFQGGARLSLENDTGTLAFTSDNFTTILTEFPRLEEIAVEGLFQVDWKARATFTYRTQTTDFSVDALSVSADVVSAGGLLISHGKGELVKGKIAAPDISFSRIDMQWQDLDLRTLTGGLAMQTHGLKSMINGKTWSGFDFSADSKLSNGNLIKGEGNLLIKQGPSMPMQFSGALDDDHWDISVPTTTIQSGQLGALLKVAQLDLPAYLTVSSGYLDLAAEVSVKDEMTATMVVNGREMDISVHKSKAHNLEFSFNGRVGDGISGGGPVSIENISLASGLDITGFESRLSVESSDSFTLRDLKTNLFEGSLNLDELRYTDNRFADTTAQLSGIDLAKLLVFADIDGLNGSGSLDITLPVSQKPAGLAITDGVFQSTVPGFLAYKSGGMVTDNIGLQALENFQYKQLTGTINYHPDGSYLVTAQLEGANPDLYDGYPVKFNLNINGSLPELFEALFVTGDFEEAILKEIKRR